MWNFLALLFPWIYLPMGEGPVNLVEYDSHGHTTCSASSSLVPIFDIMIECKLWVATSLKKPIEFIMHNSKYLKICNSDRYLQRSRNRLNFILCAFVVWFYGLEYVTLYPTWNFYEIYDLQLLLSGLIICSPSVVTVRCCIMVNSEFQDDTILLMISVYAHTWTFKKWNFLPERVLEDFNSFS